MPAWLVAILPFLISHYGPAALTLVGAGIGWLVRRYVKNQKLVDAFDWVTKHVGPVVAAVEQTYVDAVTQNGGLSLTNAQKDEALRRAVEAVMAQIPPEYLEILKAAMPNPGQLEDYVKTLIEGEVKQLTIDRGPAPKDIKDAFKDIPGFTNEKAK